jgi:HEPN domain-containing protein
MFVAEYHPDTISYRELLKRIGSAVQDRLRQERRQEAAPEEYESESGDEGCSGDELYGQRQETA